MIILTDQHLASSYFVTEPFDISKVIVDRGILFSGQEPGKESNYKRHKITESGISPRAFPLQQEGILVVTDSDEHNEEGHLIENAETRSQMVQKRMSKMIGLRKEIASPRLYGPKSAEDNTG